MKFAVCLIVSCLFIGSICAENQWKLIETVAQFDEQVQSAENTLVVVEFFAQWCGPCKTLTPFLNKIALKHENVVMLKIDVDVAETEGLTVKYKITSMPTFVFIKNGETKESFSGGNLRRLEDTITNFSD